MIIYVYGSNYRSHIEDTFAFEEEGFMYINWMDRGKRFFPLQNAENSDSMYPAVRNEVGDPDRCLQENMAEEVCFKPYGIDESDEFISRSRMHLPGESERSKREGEGLAEQFNCSSHHPPRSFERCGISGTSEEIKLAEQLYPSNVEGSTSQAVRNMSKEERSLVLDNRKIRNRASARRSRARRLSCVLQLGSEIREISNKYTALMEKLDQIFDENDKYTESIRRMQMQMDLLRSNN